MAPINRILSIFVTVDRGLFVNALPHAVSIVPRVLVQIRNESKAERGRASHLWQEEHQGTTTHNNCNANAQFKAQLTTGGAVTKRL